MKRSKNVWIVNGWNEPVVQLVLDEQGYYYEVPEKERNKLCELLDIGDVLKVVEVE